MSSLAAARADNFYHPPEYDPSKHGSLNKYNNSHGALGKRANRLHEGILVIRFEMPFDVWCGGCGQLIAKGIRFNADKKQVGNYFTTKIWSFTMRAPCCQGEIEIQTDPKITEYVIKKGARRKQEAYTAEDAQVIQLLDDEQKTRLRTDPLYRMEYQAASRDFQSEQNRQTELMLLDSQKMKEDYMLNRELRLRMRTARNDEAARDGRRAELGLPETIPLVPEHESDVAEARRQAELGFGAHRLGPGHGARGHGGASGSGRETDEERRRRLLEAPMFPQGRQAAPGKAQQTGVGKSGGAAAARGVPGVSLPSMKKKAPDSTIREKAAALLRRQKGLPPLAAPGAAAAAGPTREGSGGLGRHGKGGASRSAGGHLRTFGP